MKKILQFFVLICLFLFMPMIVAAEDHVEISMDYGVNGKIQFGRGFPLTISLTNQGESFSGDLVIYSSPNYQLVGNIVIPVELPKGEKKTYQLSIPGYDERINHQQQQNQLELVRLYKGNWKDGNKVELKGTKNLRPSYFPENRLVIGVLSDSPDTLNFLKLTKFNAEPIEFLSITDKNIPNDLKGLEMFDVIVIHEYNLAAISEIKQHALIDWVKMGGHLMIGSNPNLIQQLGDVAELSLLTIKGQSTFADLRFFPKAENKLNPSFDKVEIMTGNVKENTKILYSDHSIPMVMNKDFGFGEVTQFSFNIGSETLSNWEPYTLWWNDILRKNIVKDYHSKRYKMDPLYTRLGNIVDSFPSTFISLKLLVSLFIAYLIFLVPGLYIVLKKLDKRENSWWIIPTVAILSSIAIFIIGAKDRIAGSQINNVSYINVDQSGIATGYGAFSMFTNKGGDYTLSINHDNFNALPRERTYSDSADYLSNFAMIHKGVNQTKITFNNVEYSSIRSIVGEIKPQEVGKFTTDLRVVNGKIEGTISSSLPFDLKEAYLLTGNLAYPLGSIKANSTINIAIELKNNSLEKMISAPSGTIATEVFPQFNHRAFGGPTNKEELNDWKKFELLDTIMNEGILQNDINLPIIAGYANDSFIDVEIDNNQANKTSLSLITQAVQIAQDKEEQHD